MEEPGERGASWPRERGWRSPGRGARLTPGWGVVALRGFQLEGPPHTQPPPQPPSHSPVSSARDRSSSNHITSSRAPPLQLHVPHHCDSACMQLLHPSLQLRLQLRINSAGPGSLRHSALQHLIQQEEAKGSHTGA